MKKNFLSALFLGALASFSAANAQNCNYVTNGSFAGANLSCLPANQFSTTPCGNFEYRLTNDIATLWGVPATNDATPGGGTNYMAVNAQNGTVVGWAQQVSVVAGTQYNFSIRARNAHCCNGSSPNLSLNVSYNATFSVVGTGITAVQNLPGNAFDPNTWIAIGTNWVAPTTGAVWIQVVSNNTLDRNAGYDYLIDEVSFTAPLNNPVVANRTICSGTSAALTPNPIQAGVVYDWYNAAVGGTLLATANVYNTPALTANTSYWVAARLGTCVSNRTQVTVTVNPNPVVAAITGGNTVCVNDILALDNATAGGTWSSSNNAIATVTQKAVVTGVAAGNVNINYTVIANGCTTVVSRAVTVNGLPPAFTITGNATVCPSTYNSYLVSPITASTSYYWVVDNNISNYNVNGISTNIMVYSPASGTYNIKAIAKNGCGVYETTKAISVSTSVPPAPDLTCATAITGNDCPTLSVTNSAGYNVQWNVGGTIYNNVTTVTRAPGQNVSVKYTSPTSGCTKSRDRYATTVCNAYRLAEEVELTDENAFKVYPSPSNGLFNIETAGKEGTVTIVDVYGRTIKNFPINAVKSLYEVNIEEKGTYIIKIRTAEGAKGYKLVIE